MFKFRIITEFSRECGLPMRLIYIFLITCSIPFVFCSCSSSETAPEDASTNPMLGTWELEKVEFLFPDTTIVWDNTMFHSVYFIGESYFNFIYSNVERTELMFAGYGKYTLEENKYVEHIQFHTIKYVIGTSVVFENKIEGDLWTHEGFLPTREEDLEFFNLAKGAQTIHMREFRRKIK